MQPMQQFLWLVKHFAGQQYDTPGTSNCQSKPVAWTNVSLLRCCGQSGLYAHKGQPQP